MTLNYPISLCIFAPCVILCIHKITNEDAIDDVALGLLVCTNGGDIPGEVDNFAFV